MLTIGVAILTRK